MIESLRIVYVGLGLALWLSGCSATLSSREVRTSGLVALIDITAENAGEAVVSADVAVGGQHTNKHVVLEDADRLVASCGDEQHDMVSLGNGSYEARFRCMEDTFVVALLRGNDTAAPRSVGTLPVSFDITNSFGEKPISRSHDTLTVIWAPGGTDAEVTVELEGDCLHSEEFQLEGDPGSFVIEPGRLVAWKSQEGEVCSAALRVVRTRKGQPDPRLDPDSSVVLRQIRSTRFVSGP